MKERKLERKKERKKEYMNEKKVNEQRMIERKRKKGIIKNERKKT